MNTNLEVETDLNFCIQKWGKQAEILKFAQFWKLVKVNGASAVLFRNHVVSEKELLFGYVSFPDDLAIATALFNALETEALQIGAEKLIGPMNFAPWLDSKWIVEGWELPKFYPEPQNEQYHVELCRTLGYEEYVSYTSRIMNLDDEQHRKYRKHYDKLSSQGYTFKHYTDLGLGAILREVYAMSVKLFTGEPLHEPLLPEYLEYYHSKFSQIQPVISTCHKDGNLCAYFFNYKNVGNDKLWIFMMGATDEKYRMNGVAAAVRYFVHAHALENGCTQGVHHFIHEQNNTSLKFSRNANSAKRYALFYKNLSANPAI